ncbi:hypothetical protein EG346_20055 [Chryseobacterium carnipullorum]|uniref:Uncharacterized protein n=2 Tax=Chryseobacterium carnipullorum TaxID=1124835 RepID=A0A3G6M3U0_CHRCU|nr:hypothetical protein EG346_20055 [Chryseobacterium carnipullorum]
MQKKLQNFEDELNSSLLFSTKDKSSNLYYFSHFGDLYKHATLIMSFNCLIIMLLKLEAFLGVYFFLKLQLYSFICTTKIKIMKKTFLFGLVFIALSSCSNQADDLNVKNTQMSEENQISSYMNTEGQKINNLSVRFPGYNN